MEDLFEGLELVPVQREYEYLVIDVYKAAHDIPSIPPRETVLTLTAGVEPHQLTAAIIGLTVLIISDPVTEQQLIIRPDISYD